MHFGHTSERGLTMLNKQDLPRRQKENLIFVGGLTMLNKQDLPGRQKENLIFVGIVYLGNSGEL